MECGALIPVSFPADCGALIPALTSSIVDCLRGEGVVLLICLMASPPRGEIPKPARTGDRGDLWTTVLIINRDRSAHCRGDLWTTVLIINRDGSCLMNEWMNIITYPLGGGFVVLISEMDLVWWNKKWILLRTL